MAQSVSRSLSTSGLAGMERIWIPHPPKPRSLRVRFTQHKVPNVNLAFAQLLEPNPPQVDGGSANVHDRPPNVISSNQRLDVQIPHTEAACLLLLIHLPWVDSPY